MPPEIPSLILRADAGPGIGSGHVARCLALAASWRAAGGTASLLSAAPTEDTRARARAAGAELTALAGRDEQAAAALDRAVREAGDRPWVVFDGYRFDAGDYERVRKMGARVLAIEDGPRLDSYPVDLLLDQNAGSETRLYGLAAEALDVLGPRWALLRAGASDRMRRTGPQAEPRLLVTFGSADAAGACGWALRVLARVKAPYRAVLAAGADNPAYEELRRTAAGLPVTVERSVDMALAMSEADLLLTAGGVTMLEACAAGLPAAVVTVATNQEAGSRALSEAGAVRLLGGLPGLSEAEAADALEELLRDAARRAGLAESGRRVVDGAGASRAAALMAVLARPRLREADVELRPARPDDVLAVWRIANDPAVRERSFRREPIPLDGHRGWFRDRLRASDERFWVLEVAGAVAGQVRYAKDGDSAEVHYSVRSAFRGKGLGTFALAASRARACRELGARRLKGVVLAPNPASERSFLSAGWSRAVDETRDGRPCAVFEAACS